MEPINAPCQNHKMTSQYLCPIIYSTKKTQMPVFSPFKGAIPQFRLILLLVLFSPFGSAEWAFLQDQSQCHLQCLNGGVCAFLVRRPEVHKCICLIGMFDGDRCEHQIVESTPSSSIVPPPKEEEEDSAYEEEWAPNEEEAQMQAQRPPKEGNGGGGGQTQRFLPETNTLGSNLEHFAESRSHPMAAVREENLEEPATKTTKGKSVKGKKKKPKKVTTTTTEMPPSAAEDERRDGWMLTRRGGGGGGRSGGERRAPRVAMGKAGLALALGMGAGMVMLMMVAA